jgi:hypothetical protein
MAPSKNGAISSENRFVMWGAINIKLLDEDVLLFLFKNGSVYPDRHRGEDSGVTLFDGAYRHQRTA